MSTKQPCRSADAAADASSSDAAPDIAPAFLDFEASGLGARSWPIEAGWALAGSSMGGSTADSPPEAMFITPHETWSMDAWDETAERLHGVSVDRLKAEGVSPMAACERMNAALAGKAVYVDAVNWDGFWLMRLFQAGGVRPGFKLQDFGSLMRPLVGAREAAFVEAAKAAPPRCHRAGPDAAHLRALFEIALAL